MSTPISSGANVYTQGFGSAPLAALGIVPIIAENAPAPTTIQGPAGPLKLGQIWVDSVTFSAYILTALSASNGAVLANWSQLTSAAGNVDALVPDQGSAVPPIAGLIRVTGEPNQLFSSNGGTNDLFFQLTNGVSIGAYQTVVPPTGGLLIPGQSSFGSSTPGDLPFFLIRNPGTFPYTVNLIGVLTTPDASSSGDIFNVFSDTEFATPNGNVNIIADFASETNIALTSLGAASICANFYAMATVSSNLGSIRGLIGFYSSPFTGPLSGNIAHTYGGYFNDPDLGASIETALYADNMLIGASQESNPPLAGLAIVGTTDSVDFNNNQFSLLVNQSFSSPGSNLSAAISANNTFTAIGSNTIGTAAGVQVFNQFTGNTGTIVNAMGIYVDTGGTGAGTITNSYGGYFKVPVSGSNNIALYADTVAIGNPTLFVPPNCLSMTGDLFLEGNASKLHITRGTASSSTGITQMSGGVASISTNTITSSSVILITRQNDLSNPIDTYIFIQTVSVGIGFQVVSDSGSDTAFVHWLVIN